MKRFSIILFFFSSLYAGAQVPQKIATWYEYKLAIIDSLGIPKDTFSVPAGYRNLPWISAKDTILYLWSSGQQKWKKAGSGGTIASIPGLQDSLNLRVRSWNNRIGQVMPQYGDYTFADITGSTSDIAEGSNLYYQDSRVQTFSDTRYQRLSNLSNNTSLGSSTTFYPTQNAVKQYVDGQISSLTFVYPALQRFLDSIAAVRSATAYGITAYGWGNHAGLYAPLSGSANYLQNQYASKQAANAWIDTLKAVRVYSDTSSVNNLQVRDTGNRMFLSVIPNTTNGAWSLADTKFGFANSTATNGWNDWMAKITSSADTFAKYRYGGLLSLNKTFEGKIGATPWGTNTFFKKGSTFHVSDNNLYRHGTYTLQANGNNYAAAAFIESGWGAPLNGMASTDTVTITTPLGFYGANSLVASSNGSPQGSFGNQRVFKNGSYNTITTLFTDFGKIAGSYLEEANHLLVGTTIYGGSTFKRMIGVNIVPMYNSTYNLRPWGIFQQGSSDRNYFAGSTMIGDSTVANLSATPEKLYVSGGVKITPGSADVAIGTKWKYVGTTGNVLVGGGSDDLTNQMQVTGKFYASDTVKTNTAFSGFAWTHTNGNFTNLIQISKQPSTWGEISMYLNSKNTAGYGTSNFRYNNDGTRSRFQLTQNNNGSGGQTRFSIDAYAGSGVELLTGTSQTIWFNKGFTDVAQFAANTNNFLINTSTDDGSNKLQLNGNAKVTGNITLTGILNLPASTAPSSSADASGVDGDVKRDSAGNLYIKYGTNWYKFVGAAF